MAALPEVAFLGPKASYTHQATLSRFPESDYTLAPQVTIEDVFAAVQSARAAFGVVPFENSSNGSVVFTLDLFADLHGRYPDLLVCGEAYLAVRHCLVGHAPPAQTPTSKDQSTSSHDDDVVKTPPPHLPAWHALKHASASNSPSASGQVTPTQRVPQPGKPRTKPSHDLSALQKLYSHPQAWGQCKLFLSTYVRGVERQDVSSTSRAAELVASEPGTASAAISSRIAAELNGLDVLAEGIEDNEGNQTRFLVLRKCNPSTSSDPSSSSSPETEDEDEANSLPEAQEMTAYKTLITFTLEHGEPGALAACLAVFKAHNLNLTSINTRPSGEGPWHYVFFVEFMGRKRASGGAVNEALGELEGVAKSWRWLGSWANARLPSSS